MPDCSGALPASDGELSCCSPDLCERVALPGTVYDSSLFSAVRDCDFDRICVHPVLLFKRGPTGG